MRSRNLFNWLGLITIASFAVYLLGTGTTPVLSQSNIQIDKKIVKEAVTTNHQLKIKDVNLGKKSIELNKQFDSQLDWIKELSFKLENISDKPIAFLQVNVNFPETRLTGNLMSYGITFGQRPDSKLETKNKPMSFKSGEVLKVSLKEEKDRIYNFVEERQPIQTIQQVELEIGFIIFEDKTAWVAGTFLRQDTSDPDKYKPIDKQ